MYSLFAYGTLVIEEIMEGVTDKHFHGVNAVIHDFARFRIRNVTYPGIVPHKGGLVNGTLYCGIDRDALTKIDDFEGDLYERIPVTVFTEDGKPCEAFTYVVKDTYRGIVTDEEWDIDEFMELHFNSEFLRRNT